MKTEQMIKPGQQILKFAIAENITLNAGGTFRKLKSHSTNIK
jgi:hypothetical protein